VSKKDTLVPVDLLAAHLAQLVEQVTHQGALACVHVTNHYQVQHVLATSILFVSLLELFPFSGAKRPKKKKRKNSGLFYFS
jgi:hypothetical protein